LVFREVGSKKSEKNSHNKNMECGFTHKFTKKSDDHNFANHGKGEIDLTRLMGKKFIEINKPPAISRRKRETRGVIRPQKQGREVNM